MIAFKLNQNIDAQKLLGSIQKLVSKYAVDKNPENLLLVIQIQEISYNDDTSIPKIEYKPMDNN